VFADLPVITDLDAAATSPKAIIDRRLVKKGNTAIPQVLQQPGKITTS
jgi:hypothetical protein